MAEVRTRRGSGNPLAIHEDEPQRRMAARDTRHECDESERPIEVRERTQSADSDDEEEPEDSVLEDMQKFQNSFANITTKYRLINRIGEGTFSTVYKAEDLHYARYKNDWDLEEKENKGSPLRGVPHWSPSGKRIQRPTRKPHYVAIKKIYVTSSPSRIMNELELLHDLRYCDSICPLITAFRHQDQVIAILPYFRHTDFRTYFRDLSIADMRSYFRSLFTALAAVHKHNILHRDIKPTNFLYDTHRKRGVLVDFGLAERQGTDFFPCVCQLNPRERHERIQGSFHNTRDPVNGYPKDDRRPALRANRAGTRGFRAPEVLFKCTAQTTKLDVWSAGIILLTILSRRFPFFHSADDIDAVIELTSCFGKVKMAKAALLHGQVFETNIPTISDNGYTLGKIVAWSNDRQTRGPKGERLKQKPEELELTAFLEMCLDLDPGRRLSAQQALRHPFLLEDPEVGSEDEMDVLSMQSV